MHILTLTLTCWVYVLPPTTDTQRTRGAPPRHPRNAGTLEPIPAVIHLHSSLAGLKCHCSLGKLHVFRLWRLRQQLVQLGPVWWRMGSKDAQLATDDGILINPTASVSSLIFLFDLVNILCPDCAVRRTNLLSLHHPSAVKQDLIQLSHKPLRFWKNWVRSRNLSWWINTPIKLKQPINSYRTNSVL